MSGTVKELPNSPYSTGANGDAAEGDFDTQWALRIVGDYLLAVNAGGNPTNGSISVFKINRSDGSLTQVDQNTSTPAMDNMDSREIRAASIAAKDVGGNTLTPNFFARQVILQWQIQKICTRPTMDIYMFQAPFKLMRLLFSKWLPPEL